MAKANLKLMIDMNIELPEGDTEITEREKCAIIDRIHGYLTDIGTTSDDYEGSLASSITPLGPEFDLSVTEVSSPAPVKVIVNVSGGLVRGARSTVPNVAFDVFDEDDKEADGADRSGIDRYWNNVMCTLYPHPIY